MFNITCYDDGTFPVVQYIFEYITVLNATFIFLLIYISSYYDMFRPDTAIIRYVSPAKIVSLCDTLSYVYIRC
jgi:hypothetical protein